MIPRVSQRTFFVLLAVFLLLLTTARFRGDLPAFAWSLIVLAGAMVLDDGGDAGVSHPGRADE